MEDLRHRHVGADVVKLEFERGDDPEVASASAQGPEKVGVLGRARLHEPAVGGHDIDREQVVAGEPVAPGEVSDPPAERQSGNTGAGNEPPCRGQTEHLRLVVEVSPRRARSGTSCLGNRIDTHSVHGRKVDHQAVVADGLAGDVVPAPVHREQEVPVARKVDGCEDIGGSAASNDDGGPSIDHAVPDAASLVVSGVPGAQDLAPNPGPQVVHEGSDVGVSHAILPTEGRMNGHRISAGLSRTESAKRNSLYVERGGPRLGASRLAGAMM